VIENLGKIGAALIFIVIIAALALMDSGSVLETLVRIIVMCCVVTLVWFASRYWIAFRRNH